MSESAEKIIYVTTNGPESPEKATLPFKLANAGLALDLDTQDQQYLGYVYCRIRQN